MPEPQTVADQVARNIRMHMAAGNRTQTGLGDHLGIGQQAVSKRLNGEVRWTLVELVDTARYLAVPLSQLVPDTLAEAQP